MDESFTDLIEADVQRFVESRIRNISKSASWSRELREDAVSKIVSRAEGVYLWAALIIKQLPDCETIEVGNIIESFPQDLGAVYARMLHQVRESRRSVAAKLLQWVLGAQEPLTLLQLSVTTSPNPAVGQSIEQAVADQVSFCNHLLVAGKSGVVAFSHASVRDFLLSKDEGKLAIPHDFYFSPGGIHLEIAGVSLLVLEELLFRPDLSDNHKSAILRNDCHGILLSNNTRTYNSPKPRSESKAEALPFPTGSSLEAIFLASPLL